MPTVTDDLKNAFAGESQANRKYTAFARKADKEGFAQVARLFRAAAKAETIHALGHFEAMGGVSSTLDNLQDAVKGETYEFTEMYPPMLARAEKEGHKAKRMFEFALSVEKVHAELYQKAVEAVKAGKDLEGAEIYLCPVCGDVHIGKPTDKCPICGVPADKYEIVS